MTSLNDVLKGFTDATIFPIINDFCMDHQICLNLYLFNNESMYQKIREEANSVGDGWGDSIEGQDGDGGDMND